MMNQPDLPSMAEEPTGFQRIGYGDLAEKGSSCGVTLSDVLASQNMEAAWKRVKANKGAAGIDGMKVGDFPDFAKAHWETVISKLAQGSYLKAGAIPSKLTREEREEERLEKDEGVPQGGPLSPLLANILLDELDHELEKRGHKKIDVCPRRDELLRQRNEIRRSP